MHRYTVVAKIISTLVFSPAKNGFKSGFLKRLGDVATVLLDLVCLSLFCFFMSFRQTDDDQIRSLWSTNLTGLLQLMAK